jgi:hypothetical protein
LIGNSFRSSIVDINSGTFPDAWLAKEWLAGIPATKVASYTTWDTALSYARERDAVNSFWGRMKGIKCTFGVSNVFNRMPPLAPLSYPAGKNNNNVDVSTYSPIGRLFYASGSVAF